MQQQDWTKFSLQRPNYFAGQYLLDEDFELAHKYLSDRQRYINSRLHLAGIVEGLEVEAIAGQAEITIKSGTAIDGEGNLIILSAEKSNIKIDSGCWVCLRYHQVPKTLQEPEIPESFTRFAEEPLLTLLEGIEVKDSKTVTLAKLSLENGQVKIDSSVRQYSGVRLPSGQSEEIALQSDGKSLTIKGNLSVSGILQLGKSEISGVSQSIDTTSDRTTVVPSEIAVKEHVTKRITERLATLNQPTEEKPAISLITKDGKIYGWKTEGGDASDPTSLLKLISSNAGVENRRLTIQRDTGNIGIGTIDPQRTLDVEGVIRARHIESTNPMRHRMYPNDPIVVYQDIFDAVKAGAIAKYRTLKKAPSDSETRYSKDLWGDRNAICYGGANEDGAGAVVTVPPGYNTLWVRLHGDSWNVIQAQRLDDLKEDLGYWAGGKRKSNSYCPDGSLADGHSQTQQWLPIPVGKSGRVTLISKQDSELWLSGLAFSKNPWSHATQSARGYHWAVNGGKPTGWESDDSNGDILAQIERKTTVDLMVPYVWSGRDKLLFIVEGHGHIGCNTCLHNSITIDGTPIERLLATYDNPFARHWNSKMYNRYIAARIPANLIPEPRTDDPPLLKVTIDMMKQDEDLHFREMGTHDLELPYNF